MTLHTFWFWLQQVVGVTLTCTMLGLVWRRRGWFADVWTGVVVAYLIASTAAAWMPKHDWSYSFHSTRLGITFLYSYRTKADAMAIAAKLRRDPDNTDIQFWED